MARYRGPNPYNLRKPARPVPKIPTKLPAYYSGHEHRYNPRGLPAKQRARYWELAQLFRAGEIYSFSYDDRAGEWLVYVTEAEYNAVERSGRRAS